MMDMTIHSEGGRVELVKLHMNYIKSDEWRTQNRRKIATVAYYKAQARGFDPGKEAQDWLEAEAEVAHAPVPHEFFV